MTHSKRFLRQSIFLAMMAGAGLTSAAIGQSRPPLAGSDWLEGGTTGSIPREVSGWRPGLPVPPDALRLNPEDNRPRARPGGTEGSGPIGISRLDVPDPDASGLIEAANIGLDTDIWQGASYADIRSALLRKGPGLPVLDAFYRDLLVAQLAPPLSDDAVEGDLFLARIDALIGLGAVDLAAALIDATGAENAAVFARRMDAALLLGDERRACGELSRKPGLAPDLETRVYCSAQTGDWQMAALIYESGVAAGWLDPAMQAPLSAYLDDSQSDQSSLIPVPQVMTPLAFRLLEAAGQPVPTTRLPAAYAWSDLRSNTGWKSRAEAAERLARTGNLDPRRLRAIYSEQPPAASGGVWDRMAAVQKLEATLSQNDPDRIAKAQAEALAIMAAGNLTAGFAQMFAADLVQAPQGAKSSATAYGLALVAGSTDVIAKLPVPKGLNPAQQWLAALAKGEELPENTAFDQEFQRMLAEAFQTPAESLPDDRARGLVLLDALHDLDAATEGDGRRAARGIAVLRALGQEDLARIAALQILALPFMQGHK